MSQINLGNTQISDLKLGSNSVSEAYFGTTKIFPTGEVLPYKYWLGNYYHNSYTEVKYSDNYGPTTKTLNVAQGITDQVAMAQDASHIYTASGAAAPGEYIYRSTDYGNTFLTSTIRDNWNSIAVSDSGQYVVVTAGYGYDTTKSIVVSNDYGVTFTRISTGGEMQSCDVSRNGKYMVAVPNGRYTGYIKYSTNYGVTWNNSNLSNIGNNFNRIRISGDGKYVWFFRMASTMVYVSTDYGATFTAKTQPYAVRRLTVSDSGQYVYIVPDGTTNWSLKSSDYGATFNYMNKNALAIPSGIICSYDGKYVYMFSQNSTTVSISADYGVNWTNYSFGPYNAYSIVSRM